jgi:adenylate cyclase
MAGRALEMNPHASAPYATLAVLQAVDEQYDQALVSARRAMALGPNSIDAQIAVGFMPAAGGQYEEAAAAIVTAQRLDPNLSATDRQVSGLVFLMNGNATDAIKTLEQARADSPGVDDLHVQLAAAYSKADRMAQARTSTAEVLRLYPAYCIENLRLAFSCFRDGDAGKALLDALQRAGLPTWPHGFQGDERDRLSGEDISQIVLGHTLQGKVWPTWLPQRLQ